MIVKVVPQRPIYGILPKNKMISTEMVLDLNKNEIKHCMQFGSVYDEDDNLIDSETIKKVPDRIKPVHIEKPVVKKVEEVMPSVDLSMTLHPSVLDEPEESNVEETVNEILIEEDKHIELTVNALEEDEAELEGNIYCLFNITSGPRPQMEYFDEIEWKKFSNKFANFNKIDHNTIFNFRVLPKNNNEIKYAILIKEKNMVLKKIEGTISPLK